MQTRTLTLNNDAEKLKEIILQQQILLQEKDSALQTKDNAIQAKDNAIISLQHRLTLALRYRFSSRSETYQDHTLQMRLFDEAHEEEVTEEQVETKSEVVVASHSRKKTGRKPLPKDLPRVRCEYDLPEEEKVCGCGCELSCIGEDTSEQLDIIPAQMYVIVHAKKKYACKSCEETIKSAMAPAQAIPKSMAAPGLLSHVLVSKFCDHLPLYRQETILARTGIELNRATLSNWVIKCGDLFTPLIKLMQSNINDCDVAYSDETTVQVLNETGRKA